MDNFDLEVNKTIQALQIPPHFRGYELIKTAARAINNTPGIHVMEIYEEVAKIHGVTPSKVERNIRSALESAKSDYHDQERILGTSRELRNGEFLATLVEAVKMRLVGVA